MSASLRAAVIGLGVGEQHIAGFAAHPRCRVVAAADVDPARCAAARRKFPGIDVHENPLDLIARSDVDVVSIASPDDAHYAQILAAIEHDKHLFVEKPVCLAWDELREIRRRLRSKPGLALSSNLVLRRSPRFVDLKRRVEAGELGRLYYLEADYNYGRIHKLLEGWRGRIPNYSVMLGGGVHVVDLLLWLTGGRVTEVVAFGNDLSTRGSSFRGMDLVAALLRFEDGTVAKLAANFGCVFPHFHRLLAYGTGGTFENGLDAGRLWRSRDPGAAPDRIDTLYPAVAKGALIPSFLDRILEGTPAAVPDDDVFRTMAVCFAIDRAVASGGTARVEDVDG
jgi:predicted dehydrogenase